MDCTDLKDSRLTVVCYNCFQKIDLIELPGVGPPPSLWCISVFHKLFVKVLSKFIKLRSHSVDKKKQKTVVILKKISLIYILQ